MKRLKRTLYLLHRWLGIALCLVFALWFLSGITMMYVEYPRLTEAERLDNLPPLDLGQLGVTRQDLEQQLGSGPAVSRLTLSMVRGRPALHVQRGMAQTTLFADNGQPLEHVTVEQAEATARRWPGAAKVRHDGLIDMDQWTLTGVPSPLRPLHRITLNDADHTRIYVSDVSGQIVADNNRRERGWNWVGAIVHWIYPLQLRRHAAFWVDVVVYLSMAGLAVIASGLVVGLLRLRLRHRYKGGRATPYTGLHKWHHLLGITFGVVALTFLFSGLMSMNPWNLFAGRSGQGASGHYAGDANPLAALDQALATLGASTTPDIKEAVWVQINNRGYWLLKQGVGRNHLLPVGGPARADGGDFRETLRAALPQLMPDAPLAAVETLSQFDNYYYSRRGQYQPLPVYRVRFDDPDRTWFHVDTKTGQIVGHLTATSRLYRWLYNGLHSLDIQLLLTRRPLWDIVMLSLSLIGALFSLTGVVMGWRRLAGRRPAKPRNRAESVNRL